MAQNIKNVLNTVFSKQNNWKIKLLQNWPEIIGKLKSKVRLEKINKDSLVLGVYDSCWLQELYLLSPILLKKINEKLENQCFKRLRFKQVSIKNSKYKKIREPKEQVRVKNIITLTKKEEETLKKIKDPGLNQSLRDLLAKCHENK